MFTEEETHHSILSLDPPDHIVETSPNVQRVDLPEIDNIPVRPDCTVDVPPVPDQPDNHPTDIAHSATGVHQLSQ